MKDFVVSSKRFALYALFKAEVELLGWKHCADFSPFNEDTSRTHDFLFFTTGHFSDFGEQPLSNGPAFAFSNRGGECPVEFKLESQFDEALAEAKAVIEEYNAATRPLTSEPPIYEYDYIDANMPTLRRYAKEGWRLAGVQDRIYIIERIKPVK